VLAKAIALLMPVYFVAVEKKEPYRCGVWKVHEDALAQARRENEATIERLRRCMATDTWPSGHKNTLRFSRRIEPATGAVERAAGARSDLAVSLLRGDVQGRQAQYECEEADIAQSGRPVAVVGRGDGRVGCGGSTSVSAR